MNKKKKSVSRRETVSGKDPRKKHGMFEKLKARITKAKKESSTGKGREMHKQIILYPLSNRKPF